MNTMTIRLSTVSDVKNFVNTIMLTDCELDIVADRFVVDAKSIMEIFSLDLSKPLTLRIHTDRDELAQQVAEKVKNYREG